MDNVLVIIASNDRERTPEWKDHLEEMGLQSSVAKGQQDLRILIESLFPKAVIYDVNAFDIDLSAIGGIISENPENRSVPIVYLVLPNDISTGMLKKIPLHPMDAVLIKPVPKDLFQITMHSVLLSSEQYCRLKEEREELKNLESLRDNLMNMLVHDMRHPLQAIYSYCSFLDGTIRSNLSNEELAYQIKNHAFRLNQMLQNFLDMGRLESHQMPLFWEEIKIGDCIRQCYDRMENLASSNGLKWDLECAEEDFSVMADSMMVGRILDNFLNNAVKFSRRGQRIVLRAKPDDTREKAIFCMEDNGPGIEDQYKQKIFKKFEAHKLGLHNMPSVGLGLAFCKLAAQAHKGDIRVEDNPAGGSIFILSLPVRQETAVTPFDKPSELKGEEMD